MKIRLACLLFLASAAILAAVAPPAAKAKFSESRRFESRTISDGDSSQTESADGGKWSLSAEVPLDGVTVNSDTTFSIKFGGLDSKASLKDDPKFKDGASSAQIELMQGQSPTAVAKLKWSRDKLTVNLNGKTDRTPTPNAGGYVGEKEGDLAGKVKLTIEFGGKSTEIEIPFTGTLKRKTVDAGAVSGYAVTIDMKGEKK